MSDEAFMQPKVVAFNSIDCKQITYILLIYAFKVSLLKRIPIKIYLIMYHSSICKLCYLLFDLLNHKAENL